MGMVRSMHADPIEYEWPFDTHIYLTIDYECDYGTALAENTFQALDHTDCLVSLLERFDVPLTCFVQTEVLEEKPEGVEELRSASVPVTFHPHSHTHRPRDETDVEEEIATSTSAYREFFGSRPVGYRFPNGNVRPRDYRTLAEYDYKFDASVFPSWRPGHFDNRRASTTPRYLAEHDLYEIPFTVYSDMVRIPTVLSYCRLLGRPFTELLLRRPPAMVIFNVHMHDLVNPRAFDHLSPFYRGIYARNTPGKAHLERILAAFRESGYSFGLVDEVYETLADSHQD